MLCLIKFRPEDVNNLFDGLLFKISPFDQVADRKVQNTSCSVATDSLELINDPVFNFITKFLKINIFLIFSSRFSVNINLVTCKLAGKFYVKASFTDCKRYFIGFKINLSPLGIFYKFDRGYLCGA